MFLHEPGEEADSYDRQGMSTFTVRQQEGSPTQTPPTQSQSLVAAASSHQPHPPPIQQQSAQMARANSHQGNSNMGDNGESSALPSTANWAKHPPTPAGRSSVPVQGSAALSKGSTPSPRDVPAALVVQAPGRIQEDGKSGSSNGNGNISSNGKEPLSSGRSSSSSNDIAKETGTSVVPLQLSEPSSSSGGASASAQAAPTLRKPSQPELPAYIVEHLQRLENVKRAICNPKFRFVFSTQGMSKEDIEDLEKMPPMFDRNGGKRRRELAERARNQHDEPENETTQPQPPVGTMAAAPGLLQLNNLAGRGTTPSQRDILKEVTSSHPQQQSLGAFQQQENAQQHQQAAMRVVTPGSILHPQQHQHQQQHQQHQQQQQHQQHHQQQQQQQQVQQVFSFGGSMGTPQQQQAHGGALHTRQTSRYTFANDNPATAATSVNPRGNIAHMTEQLRMMPQQAQQQQQQQHLHNQQLAAQFYGTGNGAPGLSGILGGSVQQPPPGLKSAPTPPAPGMGGLPMSIHPLGQFAGLGLGAHHSKNESSEALLREFIRGNGAGGLANNGLGGRASDGKRILLPRRGGKEGILIQAQ